MTGRPSPGSPPPAQIRAELIVYATPTGELAVQCDRFWSLARGRQPTTAQTYPPHVTLTGFFRRPRVGVGAMVDQLAETLARHPRPGSPAVEVVALRYQPLGSGDELWLGLEVDSPYLTSVVADLAAGDDPGPDDRLRPKSWLHLSLAYGLVADLDWYQQAAAELMGPTTPAGWEVGLWERDEAGGWIRHSTHPLTDQR